MRGLGKRRVVIQVVAALLCFVQRHAPFLHHFSSQANNQLTFQPVGDYAFPRHKSATYVMGVAQPMIEIIP